MGQRRARSLAAAVFLLAGLVFVLAAPEAGAQCAMCQTALTGSPEGRAMVAPLNRAILVMMAAPYLVFATVGGVLFRHRLRGAARKALSPLRTTLGRVRWRSRS